MNTSTQSAPASTLSTQHQLWTRLLHAGVAIAVIIQLTTSLVLRPAEEGHAGNLAFDIHQFSGLVALVIVSAFWVLALVRRRGTPLGALWPWFSETRRAALWADMADHLASARRFQLPAHKDAAALPSATHGLGIALVTVMAVTGTVYYFVNDGNPDAGGLVGVVMFLHTSLASLVWIYLVGHAGLGVLQHFSNNHSLRHMWSFRRQTSKGN